MQEDVCHYAGLPCQLFITSEYSSLGLTRIYELTQGQQFYLYTFTIS